MGGPELGPGTGVALEKATELEVPLPTPDAFPFPYPTPYGIQVDLMRTVFEAIEQRKIAIVESPTGTGKSLTLLTSTLTWLRQNQKRVDEEAEKALRARLQADDPDDPPWVIEHSVKSQLADMRAASEARRERLTKAREGERKACGTGNLGAFRVNGKRARVSASSGSRAGVEALDKGDEHFLPEDTAGQPADEGDGVYLSKEVRDLMAKYEATRPKDLQAEEEEEDITKIYYTSRTHTQLRQLTSELLKTEFPDPPTPHAPPHGKEKEEDSADITPVSLVPLGSRRQLCINAQVRALAAKGGDERMNEACLDMQKSGKDRCEFLPKKEDEGAMLDARDAVLASVKDIEDIVTAGKRSCVCPYYATRRAVKQSQLVTLPYNLLLQKNAREALGIDLTNQIVVIDEAHNLIDTLLSIYSTNLSSRQLASALSQLEQYLARFRNRLKPVHALWIRQTLGVLKGLERVCDQFLSTSKAQSQDNGKGKAKAKGEMLDGNTLMARVGGGADQVNLMELISYLKESKLARKVSGFAESQAEAAPKKEGTKGTRTAAAKHASIASFHLVESFLLSLVDAKDDGRVLLSVNDDDDKSVVTLRYMLLNPAERFREVVDSARSVILAGGTMEPISDFMRQLFPSLPPQRIRTLSCRHVIPKENLLAQVVSVGPRKVDLEFKFANRGDDAITIVQLTELGAVLLSVVGLVPDGMVVFLPSYSFLDKVKAFWSQSGLLAKLADRKELFYEPQTSGDVETVLRDYALAISSCQASAGQSKKNGALLFAVVGGKLSEGINFSDSLGRCVVMVGLPYANVGSVELQERMKYVESLPGAGKDASRELYENLCMRAVNQSIGRAIRHANDYACILLVDRRFASSRIRAKLPKWIGDDLRLSDDYASVARGVAGFFRDKRQRGLR